MRFVAPPPGWPLHCPKCIWRRSSVPMGISGGERWSDGGGLPARVCEKAPVPLSPWPVLTLSPRIPLPCPCVVLWWAPVDRALIGTGPAWASQGRDWSHSLLAFRGTGKSGAGEIRNGKTWHNKSVPHYATASEGPKPLSAPAARARPSCPTASNKSRQPKAHRK